MVGSGVHGCTWHVTRQSNNGSETVGGPRLLVTKQLQPFRTSQSIFCTKTPEGGCHVLFLFFVLFYFFCFPHKLHHSNRAKDWPTENDICKISNGACSLMLRGISWNQMKPITMVCRMLESDSTRRAFHQSTQYHRVLRWKACEEGGEAWSSVRNPPFNFHSRCVTAVMFTSEAFYTDQWVCFQGHVA